MKTLGSSGHHGSADLRKFAASIFEAVSDVRFELVNSDIMMVSQFIQDGLPE